MASRYTWYTPHWGYVTGISLVSDQAITVTMVGPEEAFSDRLSEERIRVTRIIGQYNLRWGSVGVEAGSASTDVLEMHHRVYPVSSDGINVFNRDLFSITDADTDFMWHKTELVDYGSLVTNAVGAGGTWLLNGPGSSNTSQVQKPFSSDRMGFFDIKVDRTIDEGEELLWKTQLNMSGYNAGSTPTDKAFTGGTMSLHLWVRMLVRTY